jgi:hypothetical protein
MTPKWGQWLSAQCHRIDAVGLLARYWVEEARANRAFDCEEWLNALNGDWKWKSAISTASLEYASSVDCLKRGRISPTFRRAFASPEHDRLMQESASYHRLHPEITSETYVSQKHLGLAKAMEGRTLIYLDTCHWIHLRHVLLKSVQALPIYQRILSVMDQHARNKRALCPVSFPLFIELLKQSDEKTRLATAHLMDGLSGGVCFQYPLEIQRMELRQQCLRTLFFLEKSPDLTSEVWTKVGHLSGVMLPFINSLSKEDMCFMQKLWLDSIWNISLAHFVEFVDYSKMPASFEEKLATATNLDAEWYRSRKFPFSEVLQREKAHQLRGLLKEMEKVVQEIWEAFPNLRDVSKLPQPTADEATPWALPSVQVLASLSAALITSAKKFTSNDMLDFQHAALAVPYCDALFCDGPMAHVLKNKPLEFGRVYQTAILSKPADILDYLQSLNQHEH